MTLRPTPLALLLAFGLLASSTFGYAGDKIERRFEASPNVSISVNNPFGEVRIEGWDENKVELEADVKGGHDIDIDADTDEIEIELDFSYLRFFNVPRAKLELKVPHGAEIEVDGFETKIRVKDVTGELYLKTIQGDIRVEGGEGVTARLSTISGEIRFEGERSSVEAESVSGSIRLKGVAGEVTAQNTSGEIRIEDGAIRRGSIQTISSEVRIDTSLPPGARLEVETLSGSIRLKLEDDPSTRLILESTTGSVRCEVGDEDREYGGRSFEVTLGDGDGRVRLKSFSGEIRVED